MSIPISERLLAGAARTERGCLEWQRAHQRAGYGVLNVDGRIIGVHRLAWETWRGPIPDGVYVCHSCDNPPCLDVTHLFLGDATANARDMVAKGRHGFTKVSDAQVSEIRAAYVRGARYPDPASAEALRRRYGVSVTHIFDILKGAVRNDAV